MPLNLNEIKPWGRNLTEYEAMFAILNWPPSVVSVGDGPASFNAELTARGHRVVSLDPIYAFGADEIRGQVEETQQAILANLDDEEFHWDFFGDRYNLVAARHKTMDLFFEDYARLRANRQLRESRYVAGSALDLPFGDQSFDLALSSHFLFLYSEQFSLEQHRQALSELLRVAREVRVFPLVDFRCRESCHLAPLLRQLEAKHEIQPCDYRFQKQAYHYLRLWR